MTVIKQKDGSEVADWLVKDWFLEVKGNEVIEFATETQLTYLRYQAFVKKSIVIDEIHDRNGNVFHFNQYGVIPNWPSTLSNNIMHWIAEVMKASLNLRKAEHAEQKITRAD